LNGSLRKITRKELSMNAEIIELNESGMPGESQKVTLDAVPRIGELIAFGDRYFEIVNVIHRVEAGVSVFMRRTKMPYQEPKSTFGFGGKR
jgi:hypothetical protein